MSAYSTDSLEDSTEISPGGRDSFPEHNIDSSLVSIIPSTGLLPNVSPYIKSTAALLKRSQGKNLIPDAPTRVSTRISIFSRPARNAKIKLIISVTMNYIIRITRVTFELLNDDPPPRCIFSRNA